MADLKTFERETRAWLEANAPKSLRGTREGRFEGYWGGAKHPKLPEDKQAWFEMMLERGWTAPTWPTEYGGGGLSKDEAEILEAELVRLELPPPLVGFGLAMIGPTLLDYGTEAQKRAHLPKICDGSVRWCQGYSEPAAGSDLASLRMRADFDGDELVLNGQKVWTSFANKSDWIFCLVRTNTEVKKQAGITFCLVDMNQKGVSTREILLISGSSPFCEVFFEDARTARDNIIGDVNGGWTIAKALLGYERTVIGSAIGGQMEHAEQELVALAREALGQSSGALKDPIMRADIVQNVMDQRRLSYTSMRIQNSLEAGQQPGPESSIIKVAGSDIKQRRWALEMKIAGPMSLGWEGDAFHDAHIKRTREWLRSRANSIEGGTSEIQLNIIAKRVLGLPSGKR